MKPGTLRFTAVATAAALSFTGCADMSSGEPGPFSQNAAESASAITRATGSAHSEGLVAGSSVGSAAAATVVILAKHEATPRQRQVATQRARAAVRRMTAERSAEPAAPRASSSGRKVGGQTASATPSPKKKKKLPRYIAVDTEKDERTSPKAKKAVMIFDTEAQEVVGNSVYDVASAPQVNTTARFETYAAEYVGSGGI